MKTVLLKFSFLLLITLILAHTKNRRRRKSTNAGCRCGQVDPLATRIVGGVVANPNEFPWQAMLFLNGKPFCGASVINEKYVMTAGHCGNNFQPQNITVMLGFNDWLFVMKLNDHKKSSARRYMYGVTKIKVHPDFKSHENHDLRDIALMELDRTITFSDSVKPVCLPERGEEFDGERAIVTGWGKTQSDGNPTQYLNYVDVEVLSEDDCLRSKLGKHVAEDVNSMFCAYETNKDACQGDSGGPLVYKNQKGVSFQIGIISWGEKCALKDFPGVYTRVSEFSDWIKQNTRSAEYCQVPK